MLLTILAFYYAQISNGNYNRETLIDYAVVESLVQGVNPQRVVGLINKESGFNPYATHLNDMAKGCNSRGLVQIRDCNHKEVTSKQAYDPIFSVNFLIKNIDKCETWWRATCPLKDG